jgi:hypothetical protein
LLLAYASENVPSLLYVAMKPFDAILDENGNPAIAGIDGAVLPMPLAGLREMEDALSGCADEPHEDGVVKTPKGTPLLWVGRGEAVAIRLFEESLRSPDRQRRVFHWWHGARLFCPALTSARLLRHRPSPCPLCELLGKHFEYLIPVLVLAQYRDQKWKELEMREAITRIRLWVVKAKTFDALGELLKQHPAMCSVEQGRVLEVSGDGTLKLEETLPVTDRQLRIWANNLVYPSTLIHQHLSELADCVRYNLTYEVEPEGRIERLEQALPGVMLVPFYFGTKMGLLPGYKDFRQRTHLSQPWYRRKLSQSNIAALLGPPSNHICSWDADSQQGVVEAIAANPVFDAAQFSAASRGGNFWFRLVGAYDPKVFKMFYKQPPGSKAKPKPYGELRLGEGVTMIDGFHPSGVAYTIKNLGCLPELKLSDLKPPKGVYVERPVKVLRLPSESGKFAPLDLNRIERLHRVDETKWEGRCPVCASTGMDGHCTNLFVHASGRFMCQAGCPGSEIYKALKCRGEPGELPVTAAKAGDETHNQNVESEDEDE